MGRVGSSRLPQQAGRRRTGVLKARPLQIGRRGTAVRLVGLGGFAKQFNGRVLPHTAIERIADTHGKRRYSVTLSAENVVMELPEHNLQGEATTQHLRCAHPAMLSLSSVSKRTSRVLLLLRAKHCHPSAAIADVDYNNLDAWQAMCKEEAVKPAPQDSMALNERSNTKATVDSLCAQLGTALERRNMTDVAELFKTMDTDGDGEVSKLEFYSICQKLGLCFSTTAVNLM
jgi:hypothetical protein